MKRALNLILAYTMIFPPVPAFAAPAEQPKSQLQVPLAVPIRVLETILRDEFDGKGVGFMTGYKEAKDLPQGIFDVVYNAYDKFFFDTWEKQIKEADKVNEWLRKNNLPENPLLSVPILPPPVPAPQTPAPLPPPPNPKDVVEKSRDIINRNPPDKVFRDIPHSRPSLSSPFSLLEKMPSRKDIWAAIKMGFSNDAWAQAINPEINTKISGTFKNIRVAIDDTRVKLKFTLPYTIAVDLREVPVQKVNAEKKEIATCDGSVDVEFEGNLNLKQEKPDELFLRIEDAHSKTNAPPCTPGFNLNGKPIKVQTKALFDMLQPALEGVLNGQLKKLAQEEKLDLKKELDKIVRLISREFINPDCSRMVANVTEMQVSEFKSVPLNGEKYLTTTIGVFENAHFYFKPPEKSPAQCKDNGPDEKAEIKYPIKIVPNDRNAKPIAKIAMDVSYEELSYLATHELNKSIAPQHGESLWTWVGKWFVQPDNTEYKVVVSPMLKDPAQPRIQIDLFDGAKQVLTIFSTPKFDNVEQVVTFDAKVKREPLELLKLVLEKGLGYKGIISLRDHLKQFEDKNSKHCVRLVREKMQEQAPKNDLCAGGPGVLGHMAVVLEKHGESIDQIIPQEKVLLATAHLKVHTEGYWPLLSDKK